MKRLTFMLLLFLLLLVMTGCTEEKAVEMPKDLPEFVQKSNFENINWDQKAQAFGQGILGNENKSGVIGADMPSVSTSKNGQKWMWHVWGTVPKELTVVGYERNTQAIHKVLSQGWSTQMGGANNGADAHAPSTVSFPNAREWAILLYTDGELFDTLVYDIKK